MQQKSQSSEKKQKQRAAKQPRDEQQTGSGSKVQESLSRLASGLDAPDPEGQARRLADGRFPGVQRQALAGRIGQQQGNRHLAGVLQLSKTPDVQRQALADIVGQQLATMHFRNEMGTRGEGQIVVESELTPGDQAPGQFDGFGRRIQAHSRAAAETNLCAVVEDGRGKYHALRTSWPGRSPDVQARFDLAPLGFRDLYWVNRPGPRGAIPESGSRSWQERVSRALEWRSLMRRGRVPDDFATYCVHQPSHAGSDATLADVRACLEVEFADLLASALDVELGQVHVIPEGGDPNPNALINFNIDLSERGRGGIGHLPRDRETPVRRPSITIGPSAFESESELSVINTAIHESEHVRQALEASDLLEQWRESGSRQEFPDWLRRQLARRRINQEQHDMAIELWNAGHRSGEVLAYIEGFIRTYARRPITTTAYRFDALNTVARFWTASGSARIKEMGIRRLADFYPTLNQTRQDDFEQHARDMAGRAAATHRPFWEAVVDQVL